MSAENPATRGTMELFVSYAREDAARVAPLAGGLEEHGWKVFWDRKIASGKSWHEVLEGALTRADRVIVVWSQHSIKSSFVRDEAARAQAREILVPVLFDDVPLPLGFGQIQTANLVDWRGDANAEAFRGLLADLGSPLVSSARQLSSAPPISATDRPPQPARRRSLLLGSAAALVCALGAAAYIATRPPPTPAAGIPAPLPPGATHAASRPARAAASSASFEHPAEPPRPESPKQAALKLLHAYYDAINSHRFEASHFFAPRPSHYYLWITKPSDPITLGEIDAWMKSHANRSEMDDSTLEQSPSGTFSYVETQFVPQKTGKDRPYTALVAVDINDQNRITRLQTVPKRPR